MGHHQKRLAAPRHWPVMRKAHKWIVKAAPGPHSKDRSIPLAVVLRDFLGLVETDREARRVLGAGDVLVDGKIVKDGKHGVGWFDIITIPRLKSSWRVLVDRRGKVSVDPVGDAEASWKLARIENKTTIKGGLTQLNLHDGRNIVVVKDEYKTGDVLKIAVPSQEIQGRIPFKQGTLAYVTAGTHAGEVATLDEVQVKRISGENTVSLKRGDETIRTIRSYVFPIGTKKSEVTLPEGVAA
ncbi:MAG: 30S ribosomal protein S4e [Euryarchaeota archaeon]|nr:30S ribosomal protein S4e [Euryarchaeota archaeon]